MNSYDKSMCSHFQQNQSTKSTKPITDKSLIKIGQTMNLDMSRELTIKLLSTTMTNLSNDLRIAIQKKFIL